MPVKKIYQILHAAALLSFYLTVSIVAPRVTAAQAGKEVSSLLREASGIAEEDARTASGKSEISLFDAYALAVKNTERLAIEGEGVVQAGARYAQSIGAFLPRVYFRALQVFPENKDRYGPAPRSSVSINARQPIFTGLDEWAQLKNARSEKSARGFELRHDAGSLLLDVAQSFFRIIETERGLKNKEEILDLTRKTLLELRRRAAVGKSRRSEALRTQAQLYRLEAEAKATTNDLARARLAFRTLTGITNEPVLLEPGLLPEPGGEIERIDELVEQRWDIKAAAEEAERASSEVYAAWGGHLPTVYIEGAYYLYYKKYSSSSQSGSASSPARGKDYYAGLGVELPLFSGGITVARVREAESAKRQAGLNLSLQRRLARREILDAHRELQSSGEQLEAFRKAYVAARENYQAVAGEYRLNLVTILDLLTSMSSLQSAHDDFERVRLEHGLNRIRLGVATNEFSGERIKILKGLTAAGEAVP